MILSILIPSMYKRTGMLGTMMRNLETQIEGINAQNKVEILCSIDDGEKTTGQKRNELVDQAKGKYVAHVDDDDYVYEYYVSEILRCAEYDCDVMAINGFITTNGANMKQWFISKDLNYCAIRDASGMEIYHRYPNHLAPTKREIAIQVKYPNLTVGEDYAFATELRDRGLIKTEVTIDKPMYLYKFLNNK